MPTKNAAHLRSGQRKKINLALQGGGSHGAFSWGVIDRLLEEDWLEIVALTGASAGAMTAVVLADGLATGDHKEAREALSRFWEGVGDTARSSPIQRTYLDMAKSNWNLDQSPIYMWFDLVSRVASPYTLNPLNINPLKELLDTYVDFERVRSSQIQVFVSATNVETGRTRVFQNKDLTSDHVMASACLPLVFQAVEIEGVPYWDGGYMGNPPLWPLFDHSESDDVIVVQINPFCRPGAPTAARDIQNRLNEIAFNGSLFRELRAVDFVSRLLAEGRLEGTGYRNVLIHMIGDEATLAPLGASSKMNVERAFIRMLFEKGREVADQWLKRHADDIGKRSTLDIRSVFQGAEDALDGDRIKRDARFRSKPISARL